MVKVAVIGLGRFGMPLARDLGRSDAQVMAIDSDLALVNEVKDHVDVAVQLDSTDSLALESQDLGNFDYVVIAIGENFEAALVATVIAKRLGVPHVICRAQTQFHAEIFQQIGATEIIQPETHAGEHLARRLADPQLEEYIPLAEGVSLIELVAPKQFCGKSLLELKLRNKYEVNLLAIRRRPPQADGSPCPPDQEQAIVVPKADQRIAPGDILVLMGADENLALLPKE